MEANALRRWLENRVGYGNLDARFVYLGLEEKCESVDQIAERLKGEPVEDLVQAHRDRLPTQYQRWFGSANPPLQSTWRPLIYTYLIATQPKLERASMRDAARQIQRCRWGRIDGDVLLAELDSLPAQNRGEWPYRDLVRLDLASRARYQKSWRPRRIELLRKALAKREGHRFVVCYGCEREAFAKVLDVDLQAGIALDSVGKFLVFPRNGRGRGRSLAITPHPRGTRNSDWFALGDWMRSQCVSRKQA